MFKYFIILNDLGVVVYNLKMLFILLILLSFDWVFLLVLVNILVFLDFLLYLRVLFFDDVLKLKYNEIVFFFFVLLLRINGINLFIIFCCLFLLWIFFNIFVFNIGLVLFCVLEEIKI